jgi:hypothetical protein
MNADPILEASWRTDELGDSSRPKSGAAGRNELARAQE